MKRSESPLPILDFPYETLVVSFKLINVHGTSTFKFSRTNQQINIFQFQNILIVSIRQKTLLVACLLVINVRVLDTSATYASLYIPKLI